MQVMRIKVGGEIPGDDEGQVLRSTGMEANQRVAPRRINSLTFRQGE